MKKETLRKNLEKILMNFLFSLSLIISLSSEVKANVLLDEIIKVKNKINQELYETCELEVLPMDDERIPAINVKADYAVISFNSDNEEAKVAGVITTHLEDNQLSLRYRKRSGAYIATMQLMGESLSTYVLARGGQMANHRIKTSSQGINHIYRCKRGRNLNSLKFETCLEQEFVLPLVKRLCAYPN